MSGKIILTRDCVATVLEQIAARAAYCVRADKAREQAAEKQIAPNTKPTTIDFIKTLFEHTKGPAFVCSFPNERGDPKHAGPRQIIGRKPTLTEQFLKRWDKPGRGAFICVGTLKEGAQSRSKENIAQSNCLHGDIDFKDLDTLGEEPIAFVKKHLARLKHQPSIIVHSGGGIHVYWLFKEPIDAQENMERIETALRQLADVIAGDLSVCEVARVMRLPGSHNSKEHIGWREVEIIELHADRRYELSDLEDWLSEQSPVMLRIVREKGRTVGEIEEEDFFGRYAREHGIKAPIDVEQRLRDMMYMGSGENSIHQTQLAVSASLLNRGTPKADVVALLLHHTKIAAGTYGARWNWRFEERAIERACDDWLRKHPEIKERQQRERTRESRQEEPGKEASKSGAEQASASSPGTGHNSSNVQRVSRIDRMREELAQVQACLKSSTGDADKRWHAPMYSAVKSMIALGWSNDQIKIACEPYCRGGFDDPELQDLINGGRMELDRSDPSFDSQLAAIDPVDLWGKFAPPSLPRGLLPDVIECFAYDQGMDMGADPSGIAISALAVCAGAIPDCVKLRVKRHNTGWVEPARLWVALVGSPSSKKSPTMAAAVRPLRRIDADQARRYAEERAIYDKLPKEEKLKVDPPKQVRSVLQDTTIEAAQDVLKDSPDGLLCYQDELSGWFGSMDKYSAGRGSAKDRAFWLEAFNGGSYSVHRVGRGSVFIENLSISLIGGIQPEPMRQVADDSVDDGLLQRLLPIMVQPAVAGRDEAASPVVAEYAALISRLHMLGEVLLRFDEGAQRYRQELEDKHLKLQSLECVHRKLAAHIGKYDGIFARLCVVWHCIENTAGFGDVPVVIREATARRVGAFLHGFLLPHAISFYTSVLGLSNDHDHVTAVAGYILSRELMKITNRDLKRGDRTMRKLGSDEALAVFEQLEAFGWLDRVPSPLKGAPLQWTVNPTVHQKFAERAKSETERRAQARQMIADAVGRGAEP
jgi:hypothetical protein